VLRLPLVVIMRIADVMRDVCVYISMYTVHYLEKLISSRCFELTSSHVSALFRSAWAISLPGNYEMGEADTHRSRSAGRP